MKLFILCGLLLSVSFLTTGCRLIDPPDGFVVAELSRGYEFKSFSATGVNLALRLENNLENGTQPFWKKAIENELTQQTGYTLLTEEPIRTEQGLDGDLLTFRVTWPGKKFTYMAAVFTGTDKVAVVEIGGEEELVKAERGKLLASIRSLRNTWLFFDRW